MTTYRRYTDVPTENTTHHHDFIERSREGVLALIAGIFLAVGAMIIAAAFFMEAIGGIYAFAFLIFITLAIMSGAIVRLIQQNHDLVLVTEFQNALFSSIANMHSLFLLIVKANGTIHYHSSDYPKIYADAKRYGLSSLDSLLEGNTLTAEDSKKLRLAMDEKRPEVVFATLTDIAGNRHEVRLTVRPIERPKGYFLINCSAMRRRAEDRQEASQPQDKYSAAHSLPTAVQDALVAAPIGLCAFDTTGTPLFIHPDIENWLGYAPGSLHQQKIGLPKLLFQPLAQGMQPFEGECMFNKRSGALAKALVLQRPFNDAHGRIAGCCMIIAPADRPNPLRHGAGSLGRDAGDMSGEKAFTSELLDNAPVGIALLDKQGRILRYNSMFASLTECTSEALTALSGLVKEDQREEVRNRITQTLQQGTLNAPLGVALAHGQQKMASLYLSRLPSGLDAEVALVAHLIDTTEQKNLEEKYAHSQKMQAVGQLAGGIAHDFNNLLTAMIGFCDLLLMRHPAGDHSFADLMQIKQNANRAANLVRQLLAFSRRQTLQPKVLDATDVLAELSNLIRRLIGENITLNMTHGRDLGMIRVDQGQFEQVIINLAVNARDAMQSGGTLTIATHNLTLTRQQPLGQDFIQPADDEPIAEGEYVVIEVTDTGHGIPADIITKIFEPFFSTKAVGSGTGLGLATVYGIIKQTGGYIFVKSTADVGTTFALFFKRQAREAALPPAEVEITHRPSDLTGKNTVLLVEDETPVRIFSTRALRNKGYNVLEADCAETALEIVRERGQDIELIVTDVIMPGMDGPSMIKEVWKTHPQMQVIFISGYAEDALVKMEGSQHPYSFLPKPFTLKQLAEKLREVLDTVSE